MQAIKGETMEDEFTRGVVWFEGGTSVEIRETPDQIEAEIDRAVEGGGIPFVTLVRPDGEELRVNASHIQRISRPAPALGAPFTMKSPWG
jgi:hypothetical protein